eukprot:Blabericola_migrator_1__585@NODE_1144_length_5294_cov_54_488234_g778_i0_p1_GENE_NODE_1144_length_5294_cov_54_488234_g778_i0NODE_1144_length_5294_cov_54_488234_g778_i0_p1_ORF_typecomplete_len434_score62_34TMEM132D_C/PF15706_5/0_22PPARgamma_N/PF12577_8/0_087PPARgamma_N/PF12577_8/1e04LysE/PF01810_18/0_19_NODE_1144_length_5294_cov_54_488234_g778_i031314432
MQKSSLKRLATPSGAESDCWTNKFYQHAQTNDTWLQWNPSLTTLETVFEKAARSKAFNQTVPSVDRLIDDGIKYKPSSIIEEEDDDTICVNVNDTSHKTDTQPLTTTGYASLSHFDSELSNLTIQEPDKLSLTTQSSEMSSLVNHTIGTKLDLHKWEGSPTSTKCGSSDPGPIRSFEDSEERLAALQAHTTGFPFRPGGYYFQAKGSTEDPTLLSCRRSTTSSSQQRSSHHLHHDKSAPQLSRYNTSSHHHHRRTPSHPSWYQVTRSGTLALESDDGMPSPPTPCCSAEPILTQRLDTVSSSDKHLSTIRSVTVTISPLNHSDEVYGVYDIKTACALGSLAHLAGGIIMPLLSPNRSHYYLLGFFCLTILMFATVAWTASTTDIRRAAHRLARVMGKLMATQSPMCQHSLRYWSECRKRNWHALCFPHLSKLR